MSEAQEIHPELRRARRGGVRMVTSLLSKSDPELLSQTLDALREMMEGNEYDEAFAAMDGYNLLLSLTKVPEPLLRRKGISFLGQIAPPGKLDVDLAAVEGLMEAMVEETDPEAQTQISACLARISVYEESWCSSLRVEVLESMLRRLKTDPNKYYLLIMPLGLITQLEEVRLPISMEDSQWLVSAYIKLTPQQQATLLKHITKLYKHLGHMPLTRASGVIINFLTDENTEIRKDAMALLELMCESPNSKEVRGLIIGPLVDFLSDTRNSKILTAMDLLQKLAERIPEVTMEIVGKGGVKRLLAVLSSEISEHDKNVAKALLRRIVDEPENKIRIVEEEDLGALLNSLPKDIADEILSALSFHSFVERGVLPLDIAQLLLDSGVDPSANDNVTLVQACARGMADIVALLLKDPRVNPSVNHNIALKEAASKGNAQILKMLLADERVDPSSSGNTAILTACENGHYDPFALLYADDRVDVQFSLLLEAAIQGGDVRIVEELLKAPNISSEIDPNSTDLLKLAIQWHHKAIVELLLDNDAVRPLIDPSRYDNHAIQWAARNGFTEVVDLLLCDPRVDPCAGDNNNALRQAVLQNHTETVDLLLKDHRPDPSGEENFLIRHVCAKGHTEVARLLLDDPRVDPSAQDNAAIRSAARKGYAALVEELLAHDLVDPSDVRNEALISAAAEGHINIVRMLCHDQRVDPSARYNQALKEASEKGWVEVVEILLHDERVDPSVGNLEVVKRALESDTIQDKESLWKNFASQYALKHNHPKIATLVETDPRASPAFLWNYAVHNKNVDFVKLLLNDERIKDVHIKNAFSIASKKGDFDIMELLLQAENCDISLKEVGKSIATGFTMMRKKIEGLYGNLDELYEGQEKMRKKMDTVIELLLEREEKKV